ncbi:glycoside hydrolase family 61 protein [Moniliophthora roreri]|nr:glycoside hydrolase family 61 protein [Moniliophthora roreri]
MFLSKFSALVALALFGSQATAHYTFPSLVVNGAVTPQWANVRRTNNYNSRSPVTDVKSADFRCYDSQTNAVATTVKVAAGSQLGIQSDGTIYHPGVVNVYMAKAPGDVSQFKGDGNVWFKVYEESAITDGGKSINWPSYSKFLDLLPPSRTKYVQDKPGITFTIPKNLPSGQYLVRIEHIALHSASSYGGAQFYISCAQVEVTGGGNGTPGPLVAIPGVYTGNEPGILINIYYPIPVTYQQPGPAVWRG